MTSTQVAKRLGIARNTWLSYVSRGNGGAPPPDGCEPLSERPYWYEETIVAYEAARPTRGWRRGQPGSHKERTAR